MPMIMCSACMPVSAKYRTMKIRICAGDGRELAVDASNQPAAGNSRDRAPSGRWCAGSVNFTLYSKYLMTRKTTPRTSVAISRPHVWFFLPSCAAWTAIATVSDEPISTTVLMPPSVMSSSSLAAAKPCGVPHPVDHVGGEHARQRT